MTISETGKKTLILSKMQAKLTTPIRYCLGDLVLNDYLERTVHFEYHGVIRCIACARTTKKSFNQGYCFPCFRKLASCDSCIVSPEKCHFYQGTCREPEWAESHCMQPHILYLSVTSGLKVGITRLSQVPTRWIDQGAIAALAVAQVKTRYQSGVIEHLLKTHYKDKTHWRGLFKPVSSEYHLLVERERIWELLDAQQALWQGPHFSTSDFTRLEDSEVQFLSYPGETYVDKVKSIDLEKTPKLSMQLLGIKGQYWITDQGVINLRKYTGYEVDLSLE